MLFVPTTASVGETIFCAICLEQIVDTEAVATNDNAVYLNSSKKH